MAFTYDPSLADDVSKIRFALGDTVEAYAEFPDETLSALVTIEGTLEGATAAAMKTLYLEFLKRADVAETDDMRVEYSRKAKQYEQLYKDFKEAANRAKSVKSGKAPIIFGGLNRYSFNANREDSTLTPPDFTKGGIFFNRRFPELTPYPNYEWEV